MAGDEGLSEALLPRDGTAEASDGAAAQQQQQQVTVHRPFDLDSFLRFVWERWLGLLREFESGRRRWERTRCAFCKGLRYDGDC
jgi:hypothetical protein